MTDLDPLLRIWSQYEADRERYGLNIVRGPIVLYDRKTGATVDSCDFTMSRALTLVFLLEEEHTKLKKVT